METVINQHGLDIEALKSSRLPLSGGAQIGSLCIFAYCRNKFHNNFSGGFDVIVW